MATILAAAAAAATSEARRGMRHLLRVQIIGYSSRRTLATWPDEVRQHSLSVLTHAQREEYLEHGCLVLPGWLSADWVQRLNDVTEEIIDKSRGYTREATVPLGSPTDDLLADKLMIAEGHTYDAPKLTRLTSPVDVHSLYWEYAKEVAASIAEDLLGPNVRFHHSKINFKWPTVLDEVHWHQDIQFWPHTNYTPLTIGVYLRDTTEDMGPMKVVPLSVHDELHSLVDEAGAFTGVLSKKSLAQVDTVSAMSTAGCAGTVTVHNARCVHCSAPNMTASPRPLLLTTFASTSAGTVHAGTNGIHRRSPRGMPVVRGVEEEFAIFDPRPCPMAPDFSQGYVSPFIKVAKKGANMDG